MSLLKSIQNNKLLLLTVIAISLILVLGQLFQNEIVFNRNQIISGQWWKAVTGNFTHSNLPHLFLNLSGLYILMLLFIDSLSAKTFILSTIFLSIIVGAGLFYFTPDLDRYYGFSGILYGLYFIASVNAIMHGDKFTGISVALLIAGKVFWDYLSGGNQSSAELIGIPVANDAHFYGVLGAIIGALIMIICWVVNNNKRHPPTF